MSIRNGLLGLAGVLAVAATASAAPPGPPVDPLDNGREPDPIAREFYQPDVVAAFRGVPVVPPRSVPQLAEQIAADVATPMRGVGHAIGAGLPTESSRSEIAAPLTDFATGFRDAIMSGMTVPLGTVRIED